MSDTPQIFLIDNGSLRPSASFGLRSLAEKLSTRSGKTVQPVSLLHSHKIPAEALNGIPATIVRRHLRKCIAEGHREFILLPLFLGPSKAITEYLLELMDEAKQYAPDLNIIVADPIAGASPESPDPRIAGIIQDEVMRVIMEKGLSNSSPIVALVDHGTPAIKVNQLRNAVAEQLKSGLKTVTSKVIATSMERRSGPEYDFNEPLLENLGSIEGFEKGNLIVAMFFLLPGRHAGDDGDVAEICKNLASRNSYESVNMTRLLAENPKLLDILEDRLAEALIQPKRADKTD